MIDTSVQWNGHYISDEYRDENNKPFILRTLFTITRQSYFWAGGDDHEIVEDEYEVIADKDKSKPRLFLIDTRPSIQRIHIDILDSDHDVFVHSRALAKEKILS